MPVHVSHTKILKREDFELQRWEFQSPRRRMLERVKKWVALISLISVAAIFWGGVVAGLAKYLFALSQEQTQVAFLPAATIVGAYCYLNRHKLARLAGYED